MKFLTFGSSCIFTNEPGSHKYGNVSLPQERASACPVKGPLLSKEEICHMNKEVKHTVEQDKMSKNVWESTRIAQQNTKRRFANRRY